MSTTLVFNGRARVFPDDFAGTGYAQIWEAFWSDIGADLRFFQGPGATSTSSVAVGTGAKSFTLSAPVNLPAGTYKISSAGSPATYMVATLDGPLVDDVALDVISQIAAGSGTYADWIVAPLWGASRRPILAKTGAYTVAAADDQALIDCTSGTFTVSFTAAATLGSGFRVGVRNSGTGTVTLDPAGSETIDDATTTTLAPGQTVELICDGGAWKTTARNYAAIALADLHAVALSFN